MDSLAQLASGALDGAKRLTLRAGLTTFPSEILALADSLEVLDLSGNALSALPDDLPRLRKLRIIFCSDNRFTELPEVLGSCPDLQMIGFKANDIRSVASNALPAKLRWLILTDNKLEVLPDDIGHCSELQKLMLAGNRLHDLPASLRLCEKLELLRISANDFQDLPAWLMTMPRLSWLAFGGNPLTAALEAEVLGLKGRSLAWEGLALQHILGEGASGIIHQATHSGDLGGRDVAVKVFKGAVTSDGLPSTEMAAGLQAGAHPNLIPIVGKVSGHPMGCEALVLELINAAFEPLAAPPSFQSCTRDVYSDDVSFELDMVLRLAKGIASVAHHLHRRGILHGDLYAHNILHDGGGRALVGDFGAASLYSSDAWFAGALQRIEVRAYGCLLEELIDHCPGSVGDQHILKALVRLKQDCLAEEASIRPSFSQVKAVLADLHIGLCDPPRATD